MAKKDFIPRRNGDKGPWATTFKAEIATDGPTLGATPAEVTAMQNAAQGVIDEINTMDAAKSAYESAMQAANLNLKGHLKVIRDNVKRMKSHSAYTTGIGENLGIIGDEVTIDVPNSKPVLTITKVPSGYQIAFILLAFFDGVHIYRRRKGDGDFRYLATDTSSPYIDTEPMEDGTEYRAFFLLDDDEVGQPSDIVIVKL